MVAGHSDLFLFVVTLLPIVLYSGDNSIEICLVGFRSTRSVNPKGSGFSSHYWCYRGLIYAILEV